MRRRRHLTHLYRVEIVDVEADAANSLHGLLWMRVLLHVRSATQLVRVWAVAGVAVSRLSTSLIEQLGSHLMQIAEVEGHVLRRLLLVLMVDRSCVHPIMVVLSLMSILLLLIHLRLLLMLLETVRIIQQHLAKVCWEC